MVTAYRTDLEIAQSIRLKPSYKIAARLGIPKDQLDPRGKFISKIPIEYSVMTPKNPDSKLILVTAMTPTSMGEGKTTVTIGLDQGLQLLLGKTSTVICTLREPSLGPVFGMKGGAAGGGWSQVLPMEDINLHFTGDLHAITAANNLLAIMISNHIDNQGNELGFKTVTWKFCMDMNARELREVEIGRNQRGSTPRITGFDITAASEVMAIFCLSNDLGELKQKLGSIIVGYNQSDMPIFARDLKAEGAMASLLKDALKPNLVQTIEGGPAFVHGGPFANIAHGTNSIIATRAALNLSDYVVTEAGFGADLGAEKFFDIVSRYGKFMPDAAVLVASVRALKYHGGAGKDALKEENVAAMEGGFANLERHARNMKKFGIDAVVAINRFASDTNAEVNRLVALCKDNGIRFAETNVWEKGGRGGLELGRAVLDSIAAGNSTPKRPLYGLSLPLKDKINVIVKEIYGGAGVAYSEEVRAKLERAQELYPNLPVCMAKTQYSFTGNAKVLNVPVGEWQLDIKDVQVAAGAGFVKVLAGDIMTMPGLSKHPAAESIDVVLNQITGNYEITGLF